MNAGGRTVEGRRGRPDRARNLLVGALLLGVSLIAALLLGEFAVRVLRIQGDNPARRDELLGWSQTPSAKGQYVSAQARAPFRVNRLGLVGPEREAAKPAGIKRLLVLGDSFAEAFQVPYHASFCGLLQEALGPGWEVLNAGVSGYGTGQALLYLQHRGLALDPDGVLLVMFTGNDISDNDRDLSSRIGEAVRKPHFLLEGDSLVLHPIPPQAPGGEGPRGWLKAHSRLYLLARERYHRVRQLRRQQTRPDSNAAEEIPLTWHVYRKDPSGDWQRAWRVTSALLREMKKTTEANGVPLGVAILPTGWRIDPGQRQEFLRRHPSMADTSAWSFSDPDRRLGEILSSADIRHVQLAPVLLAAAAEPGPPLYSDHLTERGHRVVAGALLEFLPSLTSPAPIRDPEATPTRTPATTPEH